MILNMEEYKRKVLLEHVRQFITTTENQSITMQEIAEYCGVAKGTLYNYFPSKEDLLLAVFEDALQPYDREIEELAHEKNMEASMKVLEILRTQVRFFMETRNLMRMYAREVNKVFSLIAETKTPREEFFVKHTRWFLDLGSDLMEEIFPGADVRMIAYMFHEMLKGYLTYFLYTNKEVDLNADTERLYAFFMHGAAGYATARETAEGR